MAQHINIEPEFVKFIRDNWNDSYKAEHVQECIEAMVAELKKRKRALRENGYNENADCFGELADDVQTIEFWRKLDCMMHFDFEF